MNFQLPNQQSPAKLQNPGQLFSHAPAFPPAAVIRPATQPAIAHDQSRFSSVSRLIGSLPSLTPLGLPGLGPLPTLSKLPGQILHGLEVGWHALKDTFTFQFEEIGRFGTEREAEANCGPASASMILKQFGIQAPTMQQLRRTVGAPIGTRGDTFGLSAQQVADAVKRTASQKGRSITSESKTLSTNVDTVLADMRRRLASGQKLVLLSCGLSSLSRGHYIVVKEVRADGSILVDDPGRSQGENKVYTRNQLAKGLSTRVHTYGLENTLIAFKA